jgi:hypothetical protein
MAIKKFNEAWDENSGEYVDYNGYIDQHGEFGDIHDSLGSSKYGVDEFNNMMAELNVNENELPQELIDMIEDIRGDLGGIKGKIVDLFSALTKEDMSHLK